MCRVLRVAPSGFYAWIHKPISARAREDGRLLKLIRASHASSGGIYAVRGCSWTSGRQVRPVGATESHASCGETSCAALRATRCHEL
jgi:hypothetical protein